MKIYHNKPISSFEEVPQNKPSFDVNEGPMSDCRDIPLYEGSGCDL